MDKYVQQAAKEAFALALMNRSNTYSETNLAIWFLLKSDPEFIMDVGDGIPALYLFMKYHYAHPKGDPKKQLFHLLKERTPSDIRYVNCSVEEWITMFEGMFGSISPS
jgi:hypothetical protein